MENNLAFIDSFKCKLCRKCVDECPTGAILEIGFPVKESKPAEPADVAVS
jgi:formate hydrogenlyase subunit 6/NADH:ubiquinone oxidoreductase subunit I